jgi:Tol biopolymer transport system component
MKMKGLIAILAVLMAAFALSQTAPPSQQVQFEKALALEEAQGKLQEAIALYQKIVDESKDQALAAQAQLRIGICHQKLGHKEAQSAFQKVIDNYPGQSETVRLAREQLSVLVRAQTLIEKGDKEYKITKIHTETGRKGWLSPDGTRLVLIDSDKNTLWLRNIAGGKEVCLVPTPEKIVDCLWSPDSKLIAYRTGDASVKIVPADGGQPKTIIVNSPEMKKTGDYARPTGWTPDSRKLIFQVHWQGLYAIPASGGKWEEIYKFPNPEKAKERDEWLTLSPAGKFIAYNSTQDGNLDIYVMPARGGEPVRITDSPAGEGYPAWSYDGQWLAFISNRSGDSGTWVIRITPDGKPGGRPIQVVPEGFLNQVWTQDGKIAYQTSMALAQVFIANTDGSEEFALTKPDYQSGYPRWSPEGKAIVFYKNYANYAAQTRNTKFDVWTMPPNGGDEKFLAVGIFPAWSPDGKKIAFHNENFGARAIISIIPAEGGEVRELMNYDGYMGASDWSPDGGQIVFSYMRVQKGKNPIPDSRESGEDIYLISATGGEPKRLTRFDKKDFSFTSPRWSPDGKIIAFLRRTGVPEPRTGICTMNVDGGEPKPVTEEMSWPGFCWSRDGKSILFSRQDKEAAGGYRLYKVSAEGGKAEKLNIMGKAPDLSPDGKKITFYRNTGNRVDFWLAETSLPVDKKEK